MSRTYTCRLTDDWLPLPEAITAGRQWREGDIFELELVDDTLLVHNLTAEGRDPSSAPSAPRKRR